MMSTTAATPPVCNFGWPAPDFRLPDTKGKVWNLATLRGPKGLLIMFICNHCPYVLAVADKLVKESKVLWDLGFGVAAICSNDSVAYPEDSYSNMITFARKHHFGFPYLHDADQRVAHAYDAACTPDFFGFNADLKLQYRGRLDNSGREASPHARRELYEAMKLIAETGDGPREQWRSIGCSIKWKAA
jgi:peroxiredoxin